METQFRKESDGVTEQSKILINNISIKLEPGNDDDQRNLHPFPADAPEARVKIEKFSGIEPYFAADIVKSELVEFPDNDSGDNFNQNDMKTILFEKIPQPETKFLYSDVDVDQSYTSHVEVDPYNYREVSDGSEIEPDPDLDPFGDIDCGPSFPQSFLKQNSNISATQVDSSNAPSLKCPECDSRFMYRKNLNRHVLSHKNERAFKCPMPFCGKAFNNNGNLRAHLKFVHSNRGTKPIKRFRCQVPNCEKAFQRNNHLQKHVASHSQQPVVRNPVKQLAQYPFKCPCPDCDRSFKKKESVARHYKTHMVTGVDPFECSDPSCDKKFKTEQYMKDHLRSHTRPHKCREPGCSARFTRPVHLNSHMESKHTINSN